MSLAASSGMRRGRHFVMGLVGWVVVVAAAPFALTALLDGWGTLPAERRASLPGDDALRAPQVSLTQAIAIRAAPEQIWPWLVQLGQGRGGFYSYTWLENLVGSDIQNAERIEPRWQELALGDPIKLHPRMPKAYKVAGLDAPRDLLLAAGGGPRDGSTWLFHLAPQGDGTTRLIVRLRIQHPESFKQWLIWEVATAPASLVMQRRMLLGIRERAEREAPRAPTPSVAPSHPVTFKESGWAKPGT